MPEASPRKGGSPELHGCGHSCILRRSWQQLYMFRQAQRVSVSIQRRVFRPLRTHRSPESLIYCVIVLGHRHAASMQRRDACTCLLLRLWAPPVMYRLLVNLIHNSRCCSCSTASMTAVRPCCVQYIAAVTCR